MDDQEKLVIYSPRNRQDVAISGKIHKHIKNPQELNDPKGTGNRLLLGRKWKISNKITGRDIIFEQHCNWNLGLLLFRNNSKRFSCATI